MTRRQVLVVATGLTGDDGDYRVEARDEAGGVVAGPLVVDVAVRPGDEGLNITPEGLRWRSLNEGARSLGVTVAGWHDRARAVRRGLRRERPRAVPAPARHREPWCTDGDGHTDVRHPADQTCEGPGFNAAGHVVYLARRPGETVRLHIDHGDGAPVLDLPPSLARDLAAAILEAAADVRS